jgi:hypothetical protein
MMDQRFVFSRPEHKTALRYLSACFHSSMLTQQLGTVFPDQGGIALVTGSEPPDGVDYYSDWSNCSCTDWLIDEVVGYLQQSSGSIVLFEDTVSSPFDPYLTAKEHPPCWSYHERLFWPVTSVGVTYHNAEQAIAWAAGRRIIGAFSNWPGGFPLPLGSHLLSDSEFRHIGSSINKLVTNVYDDGGYMVWKRGE